jgi:uncharacterized protein (TIGR00251 family)
LARLAVRLTPRGGRDAVDGWAADADGRPLLKVRVSCPPVDGEANAALIKLIAKTLALPRSSVSIASGDTARVKILEIDGIDQAELMARLAPEIQ